jgi:hypothetical protein
MKQFYNSRSAADKARMKVIKAELDKLVDEAEGVVNEEGS